MKQSNYSLKIHENLSHSHPSSCLHQIVCHLLTNKKMTINCDTILQPPPTPPRSEIEIQGLLLQFTCLAKIDSKPTHNTELSNIAVKTLTSVLLGKISNVVHTPSLNIVQLKYVLKYILLVLVIKTVTVCVCKTASKQGLEHITS